MGVAGYLHRVIEYPKLERTHKGQNCRGCKGLQEIIESNGGVGLLKQLPYDRSHR